MNVPRIPSERERPWPRQAIAVGGLLLLVSAAGCRGTTTGPDASFNSGTLVYAAKEFTASSDPSWVHADSVLAYGWWDGDSGAVKLLDVTTGAAQVLVAPIAPWALQLTGLAVSDSSAMVYYIGLNAAPSGVLRAVPIDGGDPVTLDGSGGVHVVGPLDADESLLAYQRGDSTELLDVNVLQQQTVAAGFPVAFSPDGSELLLNWNGGLRRFQLTTRTASQVWQPTDDMLAARWDALGIRLLVRQDSVVEALDPSTGQAVIVYTGARGERPRRPGSWSPDGDKVAFYTERCIGEGPSGGCSAHRFTVYVGDTQRGGAVAVAAWDAQIGSSALLFSGDGHRLYYSADSSLYAIDGL